MSPRVPLIGKDLANVCRMCLSSGANSMFSSLTTEPVREIFIRSTHLYVHDRDGLPQRICKRCLKLCTEWLEACKSAQENETYLKSLIEEPIAEAVEGESHGVDEEAYDEDPMADDDDGGLVEEVIGAEDDEMSDAYPQRKQVKQDHSHNVDLDHEWDSIIRDANIYPMDPHAPVEESANETPVIHRKGTDPVILCPVPSCVQEFIGFKNFEVHCLTHIDKKNIICPICDLRYERPENYKNHMYIHANQKFSCPECDRLFTRPKTLSDHLRDIHYQYVRKDVNSLRNLEETVVMDDPISGFQNTPAADKHEDTLAAAGEETSDMEENADFEDEFIQSLRKTGGQITCPVCKIPCEDMKRFDDHFLSHICRIAKTCPLCAKKFIRFETLKCHIYSHTDVKIKCNFCPRTFVNPKTLATHVRSAHNVEAVKMAQHEDGTLRKTNGQSCSYCGKYFEQALALREHLKKHTADSRFSCESCPMTFRMKASLRKHEMDVHKKAHSRQLPPKLVNCEYCEDRVLSNELAAHMLENHDYLEFMCKVCGDVLRSAQGLKSHSALKHGAMPEPLVCQHCGRSFTDLNRLKEHLLIHTGERPFSCDICGNSFRRARNLVQHMKKIHKMRAGSVKELSQEMST